MKVVSSTRVERRVKVDVRMSRKGMADQSISLLEVSSESVGIRRGGNTPCRAASLKSGLRTCPLAGNELVAFGSRLVARPLRRGPL